MSFSGRVSVESVVVACMEDVELDNSRSERRELNPAAGRDITIKNTFIHLSEDLCIHDGVSQVRRWRSEPGAVRHYLPDCFFFEGLPKSVKSDCMSSSGSTCLDATFDEDSGSSTTEKSPRNLNDLSLRLDATSDEDSALSTPEQSPRSSNDSFQHLHMCLVPCIVPVHDLHPNTFAFTVSLRRVPGVQFGVFLGTDPHTHMLMVSDVVEGGAVDSWNKMVANSPQAAKAIMLGDIVTSVNGQTLASRIELELYSRTFVRVDLRRPL